MGVGLYIHTDFGASWLAAAKPLLATKQSTLATVCKTNISASEHRIEMGVGSFDSC